LIRYTKAHACGNDFLIVKEDAAGLHEWAALTRRLCERNTGVGADGIEFFAWTGEKSGRIRLHNADGSIAEISGNGTRCVAAWMAAEMDAKPGDELTITTDAGVRVCRVNEVADKGEYSVQVTAGMGVPSFQKKVVVLGDGTLVEGVEVSTGNPHFVIQVESEAFEVAGRDWRVIGKEICFHADFPHQTNVEFVCVQGPQQVEIRIFERGVGPTTSSGTGSSASAAAALLFAGCTAPLTVVAPGGAQLVEWKGEGTELFLTGPATLIARGEAW